MKKIIENINNLLEIFSLFIIKNLRKFIRNFYFFVYWKWNISQLSINFIKIDKCISNGLLILKNLNIDINDLDIDLDKDE